MAKIAKVSRFQPQDDELELPSLKEFGEVILVRRPNLINLVRPGKGAPDTLTNMIMSQVKADGKQDSFEITPDVMDAVFFIVAQTVVEPKLIDADEPTEDAIPVSWLGMDDLMAVMNYAMGAQYEPAANFRSEPVGDVELVQPDKELQPTP